MFNYVLLILKIERGLNNLLY